MSPHWNKDRIFEAVKASAPWLHLIEERDVGEVLRIIGTCATSDYLANKTVFVEVAQSLQKQDIYFDVMVYNVPGMNGHKFVDILPRNINKGSASVFLATELVKTPI